MAKAKLSINVSQVTLIKGLMSKLNFIKKD